MVDLMEMNLDAKEMTKISMSQITPSRKAYSLTSTTTR